MIDTLRLFEILKAGHLPEDQARAMTAAIQDAESTIARDVKSVIDLELTAKLAELKADLIKWVFVFWVGQLAAMAAMMFAMFKALK